MARQIPPGLIPVAFQRSVLTNSTPIAVNSTVRAAKPDVLFIAAETNDVRMRADAAPTLTTGLLFQADAQPYPLYDYNRTSLMKFQRSTGTAIVQIAAYRYAKRQVS